MEKNLTINKKTASKKVLAKPVKKKKIESKTATKPKEVKVAIEEKAEVKPVPGKSSYYAVGKRKTAVAQILLSKGNGKITVNELPFEKYFDSPDLAFAAKQPLKVLSLEQAINIRAKIRGGGIHAQAESLRHAISRALIVMDPESRRTLKKLGFLTRDSRVKERKKPGLKRARRAPQFSKR